METLARWAVRQVAAFDTQNLANMAWAHAKISLKQDWATIRELRSISLQWHRVNRHR